MSTTTKQRMSAHEFYRAYDSGERIFRGRDFSGQSLSSEDYCAFRHEPLSRASFTNVSFELCNFHKVRMHGITVVNSRADGAGFENIEMDECALITFALRAGTLNGHIRKSELIHIDLTETTIDGHRGLTIMNTSFSHLKLSRDIRYMYFLPGILGINDRGNTGFETISFEPNTLATDNQIAILRRVEEEKHLKAGALTVNLVEAPLVYHARRE